MRSPADAAACGADDARARRGWPRTSIVWSPEQGFAELAISDRHARLAGEMNIARKDPFDRLPIARAQAEPKPKEKVGRR